MLLYIAANTDVLITVMNANVENKQIAVGHLLRVKLKDAYLYVSFQ